MAPSAPPPTVDLSTAIQAHAFDHSAATDPTHRFDLPLLQHGVTRLEAGDPPQHVVDDIRQRREALHELCLYLPAAYTTAAGIACSFAAPALPWVAPLCGLAAHSVMTYACEEAKRLHDLPVSPTTELLTRLADSEGGKQLWDGGFYDEHLFYLTDDVQTLLEYKTDFAEALSQHGIDLNDAIERGFADQRALQEQSLQLQEQSTEILAELRDKIALRVQPAEPASEPWVHAARLDGPRRNRLRDQIDTANAHAALGTAATLVGFADPDLGRHLSAVNTAAFSVHGAVKAFEVATEIGANTNLATLALSGNLLAAGGALLGSFLGTGPTPEEIIIEEIGKLRQQVRQLRTEMHSRFDGVHDHLDRVMEQLDQGFELLSRNDQNIRQQLRSLNDSLNTLRSRVDDVAHALAYTYVNTTDQHANLMEAVLGDRTITCTTPRMEVTPVGFLDQCRDHFSLLANLVVRDQILATPDSRDMLYVDITSHPDRTTNASFQEFKRLLVASGSSAATLPASVVGPEAWFELMDRQGAFLNLHGDDYGNPTSLRNANLVSESFRNTMRAHRADLRSYLSAIAEELRVFTGSEEPRANVFSATFAGARARYARIQERVRSIQDEYYANEELFDGRVRTENGIVIPETELKDPYVWDDMQNYLSQDGTPPWLSVLPRSECTLTRGSQDRIVLAAEQRGWTDVSGQAQRLGDAAYSMRELWLYEWLGRDGILSFLHDSDVLPARLGMGEIGVCVARASTGSTVNRGLPGSLAIQIWFTRHPEFDQTTPSKCPQRTMLLHRAQRWTTSLSPIRIMFGSFADAVRKRMPVLIDRDGDMSACHQLYLERFEEKRAAFSEHVKNRLIEDEQVQRIGLELKIANAHLRSWIALALDDATWRSPAVAAVLAGDVAFPDPEALLNGGVDYAWELVEEGLSEIQEIEAFFRSEPMRNAVTYGTGHRKLNGTYYRSLD